MNGANQLQDGTGRLQQGTDKLANGLKELNSQLNQQIPASSDQIKNMKLKVSELQDALKTLNNEVQGINIPDLYQWIQEQQIS